MVAMLATGVSSFVLRLAIESNVDSSLLRLMMHLIVFIGSASLFLVFGNSSDVVSSGISGTIISLAILQGIFFYLGVYFRLVAVERQAPTFIVFSLFQFKVVPVLLISVIFLDEWYLLDDAPRVVGIILALLAIYLVLDLKSFGKSITNPIWIAIFFASLGMMSAAIATVFSKVVVVNEPGINLFFYMAFVNLVTIVCTLILTNWNNKLDLLLFKRAFFYGGLMGLLTLIGFYSFLRAVMDGSLSQVISINSLGILVPIVLASIYLGEKLKPKVEISIFLAIMSIILIG